MILSLVGALFKPIAVGNHRGWTNDLKAFKVCFLTLMKLYDVIKTDKHQMIGDMKHALIPINSFSAECQNVNMQQQIEYQNF